MPTPKFVCGAECGLVEAGTAGVSTEHWSSRIGTPTSETAPASRGGKAFRFNPSASTEFVTHSFATAVASPATVVARFFVYFTTLPGVDCRIASFAGGVAPALTVVFKQSDSTLRAGGNTASLVAASGATVTTGVWYRVDVKGVFGTTRTCDIQVDGAAQAQYSLAGQTATTCTAFSLGVIDSSTCDIYEDDVVVSGTSGDYPMGAGRCTALFPSADHRGTQVHVYNATNDFLDGGTAQAVLTLPATSETDTWLSLQNPLSVTVDNTKFVTAANAVSTEWLVWSFDDLPANANAVWAAMVVSIHHAASATSNAQSMNVVDGAGATDTVFAALDFSETTIVTSTVMKTLDPLGGAWSVAVANAVGIQWWSTDVTPDAYLDGVCFEFAYTETAGGASTNAPAGLAAGTGAALAAGPSVKPNAGLVAGTGAAQTPASSIQPNAGLGAGTGAAPAPTVSVKVNAGLAAGTGAALQPTVSVAGGALAPAGLAAGTGVAQTPTPTVSPNAGNAAGSGSALVPSTSIKPNAGAAAGVGQAPAPSVSIQPNAGLASGTGAALQPTASVKANAGLASVVGQAHQPTVSTAVATSAPAGLASGVGAALQPSVSIRVNAGLASGAGAALQPSVVAVAVKLASAGIAAGVGQAPAPTVSIKPNAGLAAGTGSALAPSTSIKANAGLGSGVGQAHQPSVVAIPVKLAPAGLAAGTGAAGSPRVSIRVNAEVASGVGTALTASASALSNPIGGVGGATLQDYGQVARLVPLQAFIDAWYFETPGDIENWIDGWGGGPGSSFLNEQSFDLGTGSLKTTKGTGSDPYPYPYSAYTLADTPAHPGVVHTVKFSLYTATAARSAQVGLVWLNAGHGEISRSYPTESVLTVGGWTDIAGSAVAPAGAAFLCVQTIYVGDAIPVGEVFYLTDVEVSVPQGVTGATLLPTVETTKWSFETPGSIESWQDAGDFGVSGSQSTEQSFAGSGSQKFFTHGTSPAYAYSPYNTTPATAHAGRLYEATVPIYVTVPGRVVLLDLIWSSAPGTEFARTWMEVPVPLDVGWNVVRLSDIAPAGTNYVSIEATYAVPLPSGEVDLADFGPSSPSLGEVYYLDEVEITGTPVENVRTAARLTDAALEAVPFGTTHFDTPGDEEYWLPWYCSIEQSTEQAYAGSGSLKATCLGTGWPEPFSTDGADYRGNAHTPGAPAPIDPTIVIVPGRRYVFTVHLYTEVPGRFAELWASWLGADDSYLAVVGVSHPLTPLAVGEWTTVEAEGIAPPGAASVTFFPNFTAAGPSYPTAGDVFYLDEPSVAFAASPAGVARLIVSEPESHALGEG